MDNTEQTPETVVATPSKGRVVGATVASVAVSAVLGAVSSYFIGRAANKVQTTINPPTPVETTDN